MAWIPSHLELREHPKLRKLARLLGVPRAQAIGHLHCLWWWAFSYAPDGDLSSYDDTDVALGAEWEGDPAEFIAALHACGSADRDGFLDRDGKRLHDWHDYGGKYVEKRRADAARKRDSRQPSTTTPEDVQRTSDGHPADGARRGEEIREEKKDTRGDRQAQATSGGRDYLEEFNALWAVYPRKVAKRPAFDAWQARRREGVDVEELAEAVGNYATVAEGKDPKHVLHGSTFFGPNERWKDYLNGGEALAEVHQLRPDPWQDWLNTEGNLSRPLDEFLSENP